MKFAPPNTGADMRPHTGISLSYAALSYVAVFPNRRHDVWSTSLQSQHVHIWLWDPGCKHGVVGLRPNSTATTNADMVIILTGKLFAFVFGHSTHNMDLRHMCRRTCYVAMRANRNWTLCNTKGVRVCQVRLPSYCAGVHFVTCKSHD